ncbi:MULTISPECIES: lipopolysaccharide assembly protein LapB [Alcaligenes]|uniref:Lipopolysaccharide assembly protein B n=1 Tax=Alcaligenes aquatilis TaxID=323284 RepID=A0A3G2HVY2_9BURK|nr:MULTISPECIES: lipopolysaccharide assembly protein LapB [Alcaligenes]AWG34918.1 lipopolysaccharide assembly protein LapB [Alcaligenes aquatilis]AYN21326.1 lipopolysaccharide assembly protein LapB [Alcaligenes aquatilis]MCC9162147.1 lipopolysaccharide assembly protein LapB [Alcaligenes sp. MMA]MCH4224146.1 lipopolysaccharide assembly protein LapB [Alcaligenes faecalis]UQN34824.1 lipopolysaccharide assembly protein LapB [Alcaligenes aquatilis]
MDFETWWLVFVPILFALGWVAARVDFRQMMSETRTLPDSYFKGLNFLLNEEPDRAIDAFVEVAKLDPETTELHFALGSLFRRRGEMERAIRVHQSLLSRADLPVADRENAQFQIAQDFLKAGMLDRAEAAFEAVRETRFAIPAMRALIRIYESEHDWPRAIEAVRRLRALVDEPVPQLVHYQCEQAEGALQGKQPDFERAAKALDEADNAIRKLGTGQGMYASQARVAGLRARVARMQGQNEQERAYLVSILSSAPEYVGLYATELLDSYRKLGRGEEGVAMLRSHYQQHPSLDIFNVLFRVLREQEGHLQAWAFARDALRAHPSLLGLDKMLEVELQDQGQSKEGAEGAEAVGVDQIIAGADLSLLRSLIHRHTQRLDRYSCSSCGFEARHFYWQCPGCNSWETYAPRRLEELK